jgi:hypothetical protein
MSRLGAVFYYIFSRSAEKNESIGRREGARLEWIISAAARWEPSGPMRHAMHSICKDDPGRHPRVRPRRNFPRQHDLAQQPPSSPAGRLGISSCDRGRVGCSTQSALMFAPGGTARFGWRPATSAFRRTPPELPPNLYRTVHRTLGSIAPNSLPNPHRTHTEPPFTASAREYGIPGFRN